MQRFLVPLAILAGCVVWACLDLAAQKLFARLVLPAGLCWLGLAWLAVAAWRADARRLAAAAATLWLLYSLTGNAWVGGVLMTRLESLVPEPGPGPWPAAAVLGGGTDVAPDGSPQLGGCGDRLRVAAGLWRTERAPLLVAVGSAPFDAGRDVAVETAGLWREWGVPAAAVHRLPGPRTTSEEIAALKRLADERGWKRLAIVTSAWHLPRALALCRRAGLDADGIPADRRGRPAPFAAHLAVPCGQGFELVQTAGLELLGRLIGR